MGRVGRTGLNVAVRKRSGNLSASTVLQHKTFRSRKSFICSELVDGARPEKGISPRRIEGERREGNKLHVRRTRVTDPPQTPRSRVVVVGPGARGHTHCVGTGITSGDRLVRGPSLGVG